MQIINGRKVYGIKRIYMVPRRKFLHSTHIRYLIQCDHCKEKFWAGRLDAFICSQNCHRLKKL